MKFLYIDESGNNPSDQYLVFFALQIDAYKLKKAMKDARPLLAKVSMAYPDALKELKASSLVNGKRGWGKVDPGVRKRLFIELCGFVNEIGAEALTYVLDHSAYRSAVAAGTSPSWASTPWLTGATTMALLIQKYNQGAKNNKGLSVVIFDDNRMELPSLSDFLMKSSKDMDECYERQRKSEPFDHIIDTAFAIKSEHSRLVQISDACSYALRRRAELGPGGQAEAWPGEQAFIEEATAAFADRIRFPSKIWVPNPPCENAKWVRDSGLRNLNKWVKP
jgi:hypothetical protein